MKLICYPLEYAQTEIRPAPATRDWMDRTTGRAAYRCLPLAIANGHGWEILCPVGFQARWNGGDQPDAVTIEALDQDTPPVRSHFGYGILTFYPGHLFRTENGYDLMVTGPTNRPKCGIAPLSGIVETDWSPYHFTMNWQFTRPGVTVRFEKGEPFCLFFPMARGLLETFQPEIADLREDPELKQTYEQWSTQREHKLTKNQSNWEMRYAQGRHPDGRAGLVDHRTKLKLKPFTGKG